MVFQFVESLSNIKLSVSSLERNFVSFKEFQLKFSSFEEIIVKPDCLTRSYPNLKVHFYELQNLSHS